MLKQRLDYVDIFRGFALVVMISLHIFTTFSTSDIYTKTPYYIGALNSPTILPPPLLFTFVSGMSLFLFIQNRKDKMPKGKIFFEAFKRYGKYILISLPFTVFMFGLNTYLTWNEAIQGIGLTAIFVALFLLLFRNPLTLIASIFITSLLRVFLLSNVQLTGNLITDTLMNSLFRGWFSVLNFFPLMIAGILFITLIKKNAPCKKLFIFSFAFLIFGIILHLIGSKIDYYDRSFAFTFAAIGWASLIYSVIYSIYKKSEKSKFWDFFKVMGIAAFFIYIMHFLFIIKPLQFFGIADRMNDLQSWLIAIPLVILVYIISKGYLKIRMKLPAFLRL
jgi:hypothetical protein